MDCDGAIERVYTYLDGELTVWKRQAITRHLDECPPCAQGFYFEVEIRRVIAKRCRDEAPAELRRRIAESIDRAPPPDR
jgi:mycothiol system anti-sigma-R factor